MTLSDLAGATGIPLSTLQRTEGQDDVRVGYQDIAALAKFYGVSTDYLFDLADNRKHRHIEVDALNLTEQAIETLKGNNLNNRLLSELIAHPDFPKLMKTLQGSDINKKSNRQGGKRRKQPLLGLPFCGIMR